MMSAGYLSHAFHQAERYLTQRFGFRIEIRREQRVDYNRMLQVVAQAHVPNGDGRHARTYQFAQMIDLADFERLGNMADITHAFVMQFQRSIEQMMSQRVTHLRPEIGVFGGFRFVDDAIIRTFEKTADPPKEYTKVQFKNLPKMPLVKEMMRGLVKVPKRDRTKRTEYHLKLRGVRKETVGKKRPNIMDFMITPKRWKVYKRTRIKTILSDEEEEQYGTSGAGLTMEKLRTARDMMQNMTATEVRLREAEMREAEMRAHRQMLVDSPMMRAHRQMLVDSPIRFAQEYSTF